MATIPNAETLKNKNSFELPAGNIFKHSLFYNPNTKDNSIAKSLAASVTRLV
ncbi:MAG: hypothetical protein JXR70_11960 [Spirochaetales bacterium]|nr:hypothetical protein [Spirochaetales bacterium]